MQIRNKHGTEYEVTRSVISPGVLAFHVCRDGMPIARAALNVARTCITDIVVYDQADRRKGIASALYDHIEREMGFTLVPNRLRLSDGRAFWKSRQTPQRRALGPMAPRHVKPVASPSRS